MKVYKCRFTNDEVCSESYPELPPFGDSKLLDAGFEVRSHWRVKGEEDYGISDNSEEADGGPGGSSVEKVVDLIDSFQLQETNFTKKDFGIAVKAYMSKIKKDLEAKNPDRVKPFMEGAQSIVKSVLGKFDEVQFFYGESFDPEAVLVFAYCIDGETTPRFVYIRDALVEERY